MKVKRENFIQKVTVHNEFTLKIMEYDTPACKNIMKVWKAKAYNTVLNQGLQKMTRALSCHDAPGTNYDNRTSMKSLYSVLRNIEGGSSFHKDYGLGGWIQYGDGNTPPVATNTSLNNYVGEIATSWVEGYDDIAEGYAYGIQKAVVTPETAVGVNFREVGLASYVGSANISTHALIVDSEGLPITITKTNTMQIEIYSKVYITLSNSYSGLSFIDGSAGYNVFGNALLKCFSNQYRFGSAAGVNNQWYSYGRIELGSDGTAINQNDDEGVLVSLGAANVIAVRDLSNYKITFANRFGATEGNGKVKEIAFLHNVSERYDTNMQNYFSPVFRALLPITGVFEGTTFTNQNIGTGDDTETEFTLSVTDEASETWLWNEITPGSLTVYVDGVAKASGVDYTYDDATGTVSFTSPPTAGAAITATWTVPYIAKDNSHVLDISFSLVFGNGSIPE